MDFRNKIIMLLAGAAIWLVADLYNLRFFFFNSVDLFRFRPVEGLFLILRFLVPLSVLLFAVALLNKKNTGIFDDEDNGTNH